MSVNASPLVSRYWMLVVLVSVFTLFSFAFADTLSACPFTWERNLKAGSTGADVLALQKFLNSSPETRISDTGAGSPGNESSTFGPRTKTAVIKFQEKYSSEILAPNDLVKGTGSVGVSTRAKLNSLCVASAVSQTNPPSLDSGAAQLAPAISAQAETLTVSDPGQPESSIAPANVGAPFLSFTLAAGSKDVVVRSVVVRRAGLGADGALSSLGLYGEDGLQIGNIRSLNGKHEALFSEPFTIPANASQKFDVYVNTAADLTNYNGQIPYLELVGIDASSPVSGALPLRGTPQVINASLIVGSASATRSPYDPGVATTRYINDAKIRFSGIKMTADSKEDLTLDNIIWKQAGTAGSGDISNVVTVVDGKSYATTVKGKDYISFFDPGIVIKKGQSIDVYIQGDLMPSGVNRTVKFDIYDNTDDVALSGNTYGLGVGVSPSGNTDVAGVGSAFITSDGSPDGDTGIPFYSGSTVTVSGGAATSIGKN